MDAFPVKLLILYLVHYISAQPVTYNICAFQSIANIDVKCRNLGTEQSRISCVKVGDSVDCALKLLNETADFGLFHPEHAVTISKSHDVDNNMKVLGEIRASSMVNDNYEFQTVAVVRRDYSGGLSGLKNKNYCQGFTSGPFSGRVSSHFEKKVASLDKCDLKVSAVEDEISRLSSFFKSACKPGKWAEDNELDARLKRDYSNLCSLCDSKCQYDTTHHTNLQAALDCLTQRSGDVSYVTHRTVKTYFGLEGRFLPSANASEYKFLCPDGTELPLDVHSPCVWTKQPWSLIVSRSKIASDLQTLLNTTLYADTTPVEGSQWIKSLQEILLHRNGIAIFNTPKQLTEVIDRGCDESSSSACRREVKWCTLNMDEKRKCDWMRNAAITQGLAPVLSCMPTRNMTNCMSHITNKDADIISVNTEYGYIARKVFNLSSIAFEESSKTNSYKILVVIKKTDRTINGFKDLRGKKACFPEYRGLGWLSFVKAVTDAGVMNSKECPDYFYSSSCAPGSADPNHLLPNAPITKRLCYLCSSTINNGSCGTTSENEYYGTLGAMKCLQKSGDVAFVDYNQLVNAENMTIDLSGFRVLCKNGSLSSLDTLDVDDDCSLGMGIKGEIVGEANISGVRQRDISELLLKLSYWFGNLGAGEHSPLHIFDSFNGLKGLLFKDGTLGLVQNLNHLNSVQSYVDLVENVNDDCRSSSSILVPSLLALLSSLWFAL